MSKENGKYEQAIDNFTFQTGENTFCFVGIFENEQAIIDATSHKVSTNLGVKDPVSGPTID